MPGAMSVSITGWLNTDVAEVARTRLMELVAENKARVLAEQAQRSGGIEPALETMIIDGSRNASVSQIKASSRVILDWNYITEAVIKTVGYLRLHGPERSGAWKESIIVLVNGREQPVEEPIPSNVNEATVVVTAPYSRKLEVGRTESGRAFSTQVPQHFVEKAMLLLRSQLRDLATLSFGYVNLSGGHVLSERGRHRRAKDGKLGSKRHETRVQHPAITINEIQAI